MSNAKTNLPTRRVKVKKPQGDTFPFHSDRYQRDTRGMSYAEHGAYLLAIIRYWDKGEALTYAELEETCGAKVDRVCQFFHAEGGKWHHKRIDAELDRAIIRNEIARRKSAKGVAARRALGQIQ